MERRPGDDPSMVADDSEPARRARASVARDGLRPSGQGAPPTPRASDPATGRAPQGSVSRPGALATPATLGRYQLLMEIAQGGMATVFLARMHGKAGFERMVAVKVLHRHLAGDPEFVAMFLDEARLAARVRHPNVVDVFDVDALEGELIIVMSYIEGIALSRLIRATRKADQLLPVGLVLRILHDALRGLHAAHELRDSSDRLLNLIHRDVSPHNILVGTDGVTRVADFGIAKARGRITDTQRDTVKGKLRYLAPEQLTRNTLDRRLDLFSAGAVLWEALVGRPLFEADSEGQTMAMLLSGELSPPSKFRDDVSPELDHLVMRALERDRDKRFQTAAELADAIDDGFGPELQSARRVAQAIESAAAKALENARRFARESSLPIGKNEAHAHVTPSRGSRLAEEVAELAARTVGSGVRERPSGPATLPPALGKPRPSVPPPPLPGAVTAGETERSPVSMGPPRPVAPRRSLEGPASIPTRRELPGLGGAATKPPVSSSQLALGNRGQRPSQGPVSVAAPAAPVSSEAAVSSKAAVSSEAAISSEAAFAVEAPVSSDPAATSAADPSSADPSSADPSSADSMSADPASEVAAMEAAPVAEEILASAPTAEVLGVTASRDHDGESGPREALAPAPDATRNRTMRVVVAAALAVVGVAGIVALDFGSSSGTAARPDPRTQASVAASQLSPPAARPEEQAAPGAEREGDAVTASAPSSDAPSPPPTAAVTVEPESPLAVAAATATATAATNKPPGAAGTKRPPPSKRKPKPFIPSGL